MWQSNENPVFRSKFAEDIFKQKYAHEGAETWDELCSTLVDDVCGRYVSKDVALAIKNIMKTMKFIPGGRYLYYAGRTKKFFNNCFRKNTRVLTDQGWRRVEEEGEANVLSPVDGKYYPAPFVSRGVQEVFKYTFAPLRGGSKQRYDVYATRNHEWVLANGDVTDRLSVGDVVPATNHKLVHNTDGYAHGFLFGDGTEQGQVRVCGAKAEKVLPLLIEAGGSVTYPEFACGDPCVYFPYQKVKWKQLPEFHSPEYIASFIEGWIDADGSEDRMLYSVNKAALNWFRDHAAYAGIVISGELRSQVRDVRLGEYTYHNHEVFIQNYSRGHKWQGFKCVSVDFVAEEEVFCPFEKVHNRIVIDHGIDTRQCYLLSSLEDSREDWGDLSRKVELCLATGGGIGVDYSRYRAEGSVIKGTGGIASGPLSKMEMTNGMGRHIMQGGTRRSALYASLDCDHPDVDKFLVMKDWHNMHVAGTDKTVWDLKQADFNYNAPMDITNISVNYNTKWLMNYWKTGDYGHVFRKNVEQAIRTGEPGFSFNFFDKENEKLRNACTEVTSEDDSDVCNLGSINMSRIDDIADFNDVVTFATIFLLCGTLVSELPYDKVYDVRAKNRRLGLGLMGVHEWLLKRGYKYEVTDELRRWLSVYEHVSDAVAKSTADKMDISRPVAVRAIAPTGTIGILAGTTTGIEPIFAVAYKRRYMSDGKKWKYQYVIDSTANELILNQGVDPEAIESAIDLAEDFERRIDFQVGVQEYVDMGISSTINLPAYKENKDYVDRFARYLADNAHRLRGFTCYPDGSRGGQPLVSVPYNDALDKLGEVFEENVMTHDICEIGGKGGVCGV